MRKPPSYRKHKPTNQSFVELNGKRIYLGKHGTAKSKQRYDELIAEWLGNGRQLPASAVSNRSRADHSFITVGQLIDRFNDHASQYYRTGNEAGNYAAVGEIVKALFDTLPVNQFTPRDFKAVRDRMVAKGWVRLSVNRQANRLRHIFKWGVEEAIVQPPTWHALLAVGSLKRNRTDAPESAKVKPVPMEQVNAIKPFVSRQVWAVIQLQLLTAARCSEILSLRAIDIDMSGKVWTAQIQNHKTVAHGHERFIHFGPKAQAVLRNFLKRKTDAYLFSPREADAEFRAKKHKARKTRMSCGNAPGTNVKAKPKWMPGECYTKDSYGSAIRRACARAGIKPAWHSHQLRHAALTTIRSEASLAMAQIIAGHANPDITLLYAESDQDKAKQVMAKIG